MLKIDPTNIVVQMSIITVFCIVNKIKKWKNLNIPV